MLSLPAGADLVREFPASPAQEARWRGASYDIVNRVYRLRGDLDRDALVVAVQRVVDRHQALRCGLRQTAGGLVMRVEPRVPAPLRQRDAEGASLAEREQWQRAWVARECTTGFERGRAPLMRLSLIRVDQRDHVLVVVIDHIVCDGWSVEVFARELSAAYRAAVTGAADALPADIGQFPPWAAEQRALLTAARLAALSDHWTAKFPGGPSDLGVALPAGAAAGGDRAADPVRILHHRLDAAVTAGLREAARRHGLTLNALTAAALVRRLQADTGRRRITVSTSSAARFTPRTESMIGYLATTIWIPTTLDGASDLPTAARAFHRDLLGAMAGSQVPARVLFDHLWGPGARAAMDAAPQVGFLCTPFWGGSLTLPGIDVEAEEFDDRTIDGALSVFLTDRGTSLDVDVRFSAERLCEDYGRGLLRGYLADLTEASRPSAPDDGIESGPTLPGREPR
jgi:hypothetical protein